MTRKHLLKARNIAENPNVSLVVPLTRRFLWFLPPPTIQLHGQAQIVDWTDEEGTDVFRRYMVGYSIWQLRKRMESGAAKVVIPPEYRSSAPPSTSSILSSVSRSRRQATACLSADHDGVW